MTRTEDDLLNEGDARYDAQREDAMLPAEPPSRFEAHFEYFLGTARAAGVPDQFAPGLARWVAGGVEPGGFLCAVLRNDLLETVGRADDGALPAVRTILRWALWYAPTEAFGSAERVAAWARKGGTAYSGSAA